MTQKTNSALSIITKFENDTNKKWKSREFSKYAREYGNYINPEREIKAPWVTKMIKRILNSNSVEAIVKNVEKQFPVDEMCSEETDIALVILKALMNELVNTKTQLEFAYTKFFSEEYLEEATAIYQAFITLYDITLEALKINAPFMEEAKAELNAHRTTPRHKRTPCGVRRLENSVRRMF